MKLGYTTTDFSSWIKPNQRLGNGDLPIHFVSTDTRKLNGANGGCFFALQGDFRSGESFIDEAYQLNIRVFVLSHKPKKIAPDAVYFVVENPLAALQIVAMKHREKFNYPIIAIVGKNGKTTVKEWIYELIKSNFHVVRSPKSYNTTLGVPLSLLELSSNAEIALIELGVSKPEEIDLYKTLVSPTHLVITNFYKNEDSLNQSLIEWIKNSPMALVGESTSELPNNIIPIEEKGLRTVLDLLPFKDEVSKKSALIAIRVAQNLGLNKENLATNISKLKRLALRMETFNGINNTTVINDSYNLDLDALRHSLEYLTVLGRNRKKAVIIGLDEEFRNRREEITQLAKTFNPEFLVIDVPEKLPHSLPENSVVLIKGTRKAAMEKYAAQFREKQHQTKLEINLTALRHNLVQFRKCVDPSVKILAMVKAQSYGSGMEKLAEFFELQGLDYLGVAYTSEGVSLRKQGIKLPILVLNPDPDRYLDCVEHDLEPTVFTFNQMDALVRILIESNISNFPIHIEVDTGMRRLGFEPSDMKSVLEVCQAQPELYLKGVFTHFVESDNAENKSFSHEQIKKFNDIVEFFTQHYPYELLFHMANSEAICNYPESHFSMVRLGLGMYGISNTRLKKQLQSVLTWKSVVSQVKHIEKGDSVGYSRSFLASRESKIAVIPLGYADGFPRALSNGVGGVWINARWCPTVGKVCMDMTMVDVTDVPEVEEGSEVIIFNSVESLEKMASALNTIPYEVMSGISQRVHRVYFSE